MLFDAHHDAELLHRATKSSWSTDHKLLIHVVAENERTSEQMQELRQAFWEEYNRCPIEAVKKATNLPHQSAYSNALVATLLTREEFAAECLHQAMAGLGTDERAMIQILAHSTKEEVERIKETYLRMYGKTLEADIDDDTSGAEREFFWGLVNAPRSHVDVTDAQDEIKRDVAELYLAGQAKWSSDISAFIQIITKHDNEYLAALNLAYGRVHGDTLIKAVEEEVSGCVEKGMKAMIMDRADFYASELKKAISGGGTNSEALTRIIATQRHTMPTICQRYMTKYGKNLRHHMEQESAINDTQYGKVILSLLKVAEATGEEVPAESSSAPQGTDEPNEYAPSSAELGEQEAPTSTEPAEQAPTSVEPSEDPSSHLGYSPYTAPEYPPLEGLSLGDKPGYPPAPAPDGPPPAYPPPGYTPAPYGAPIPGYPPPYGAPPLGAPLPGYPPPNGGPPPGYPPPYGAPPPFGAPPPGYPLPCGAPPPGYPPPYGAPPPGYPLPYGAPPPGYHPPNDAPPPGYPPAPYEARSGYGMPYDSFSQHAPNPHYPPPPPGYPATYPPPGAYYPETGHKEDKKKKKKGGGSSSSSSSSSSSGSSSSSSD